MKPVFPEFPKSDIPANVVPEGAQPFRVTHETVTLRGVVTEDGVMHYQEEEHHEPRENLFVVRGGVEAK